MQQTIGKKQLGLIMTLTALLISASSLMLALHATQASVLAQTAPPTTTQIGNYLVIGMGDDADIDNAFQMSNSEIGADKNILSAGEAVGFGNGSSFPNLRDVFTNRWNLATNPDSLNNATACFQGVDWSGNVALTSDNSSFDSANSLVYANLGIRTAAAKSQFDSVDSQSRYFPNGNSTSPVALRSQGTSNNNNLAAILTELSAWKSFINGLSGEATITKAQIESIFVNNSASNGNGGLRQTYGDALDTNNDGIILVDVNTQGIDFAVNNTDWVINGTGNKLVVFRINNGANMVMSNASITLGTGGIASRNIIFYHASEPALSSDTVFSGSNVVLCGGAFWDLNDVGESGSGSDGHNIVINNGQGCWQFISQKINFQNNRWNRCAPSPAPAPASLGDRVWNDANRNGIQDAGEAGVPNVTITLLSGCTGGTVVRTATTNAGGNYSFTNLTPGQYRIQVTLPGGFQFSLQNQGGNDTVDSDVNTATGVSDCITLAAGQNDPNWDAGINQPPTPSPTNTPAPQLGSLGDRVWNDFNRNGIQDAGEPGVPGVTVQLKNCSNTVLQSQQTDGNGIYRFINLSAGCYRIGVILPGGFQFSPQDQGGNDNTDSDVNPATAMTSDVNLGAGQNIDNIDAGINQPVAPTPTNTPVGPTPTNTPAGGTAALGDRVWNDTNSNGVQDIGERGVPGVTVQLLAGCTGTAVLAARTTNANGDYIFSSLAAGQYRVRFTLPAGFTAFSPKDAIPDDDYDSDANLDGVSDCITLNSGEENYRVDAGLVSGGPTPTNTPVGPTPTPTNTPAPQLGSLGDRVWNDLNRNGSQDAGEPGVAGVTVQLKDCANNILQTQQTNGSGNYTFSNLNAGCYRIGVVLPAGFQFSPQDQGGNDNTDSDVNPATAMTSDVNLGAGQNINTVDAGINQPVAPTPTNTPVGPTPTNTPSGGTAALGDRVWNDTNGNGVQDIGERGVPGVTVQLLAGCTGTTLLAARATNANGDYIFSNLAAGQYRVRFILPAGFTGFSPKDAISDDDYDSDANPDGVSDCITLNNGEENYRIDAGLVSGGPTPTPTNTPVGPTPTPTNTPAGPTLTPTNTPAGGGTAALGDRVWNDTNGNGVQNGGERGVPGVTVELLAGCTETTVLATRLTNVNGGYVFSNLAAGQYRVRFTLLAGFTNFSPKDAILDDDYDSDANPGGVTDCITLSNGEQNFRVDAGLVGSGGPTPTPTNTPAGPTPTPTNTPVGPTPTPTPQVGGPLCYVGPCPDTDGDGIPDYLDEDDDNDGIPSTDEDTNGNGNLEDDDSDGDGIPNYLDPLDSDNDTIPDIIEDVNRNGNLNDDNTDGDGLPNYRDTDSDNDGILDRMEVGRVPSFPYDADRDGTPDYLDRDSDNDGQSDAAEGTVSRDGDGIPDYVDPQDEGPGSGDSDNDGVPDAVECPPALLGAAQPDLDRDGIPDYLDRDLVLRFYLPLIDPIPI